MTSSKAAVHWTEEGIKIWAVQSNKTTCMHINVPRQLFTKTESCSIDKLYWLCTIYVKAVSAKSILATPSQDLAWRL